MKILALNCGSSSIKYSLFEDQKELTSGLIERIGEKGSKVKTHNQGIKIMINELLKSNKLKKLSDIKAVGHRVVHGGELSESCIINKKIINKIKKVAHFAPLHNPVNLIGILEMQKQLPNTKQVAVFDTAFHQTMPEYAYVYALPYDFYKKQNRLVLENCGRINPRKIEDAIANGTYLTVVKTLYEKKYQQVIDQVTDSGLRGRGGGGFPAGVKWNFCRKSEGDEKYLICNADEGDPGAFMDRSTLEGDPHSVLEGMIIAAFDIGASHGYIYVRAEYPLAIRRFRKALESAKEYKFLGKNILDSALSTLERTSLIYHSVEEVATAASINVL